MRRNEAEAPAPARSVALAYTPPATRPALRALFDLDAALARSRGASEPLLGQIRLAWWREELAKPPGRRAAGQPVLERLGRWWNGEEPALIALIDGWEAVLGVDPLPAAAVKAFAGGRGEAVGAFSRIAGVAGSAQDAVLAGRRWALAELAAGSQDEQIRQLCHVLFCETAKPAPLPRPLRGIAVLEGLAARSVARGEPLMAGRGGALAALRLGLLGR